MTETQKWIEDMIAGGFVHPFNKEKLIDLVYFSERQGRTPVAVFREEDGSMFRSNVAELLLMPLAWQAVGSARGWEAGDGWGGKYADNTERITHAKHLWHTFIDHLADGLSIEDSLSMLK